MKTLNSEPRITLNWVPGAWAGYGYTGAPTLKADAFNLAMAMAELRSVAAERDKLSEALQRNCVQYVEKQQALIAERDNILETMQRNSVEYIAHHKAHRAELDTARQSLRAAEQDVAELEADNSTLRTVNARLVADLAAAMERLNHAESIIMQ